MNAIVIETKLYQSKGTLIKLNQPEDIVNNLKYSDTWKTQLTIEIDLILFKGTDEERVMHSKINNIELMIYDNTDEVIEKTFEPLLNRYQIGLETSIKSKDFVFDYVYSMCYKCH